MNEWNILPFIKDKLWSLCTKSINNPEIIKNIFEYKKYSKNKNKAIIEGKTKFEGAELMSSDLRASVALVLAAIVANGISVINRIYHLDRGYECLAEKLSELGASIEREKNVPVS